MCFPYMDDARRAPHGPGCAGCGFDYSVCRVTRVHHAYCTGAACERGHRDRRQLGRTVCPTRITSWERGEAQARPGDLRQARGPDEA